MGKGMADPYEDHKTVIFDEFKGCKMPAHAFLELIGNMPTTVNVKGSVKPWLAETIIVTANYDPRGWWPDAKEVTMAAIRRRITTMKELKVVRPEVKLVSWDEIPEEEDTPPLRNPL